MLLMIIIIIIVLFNMLYTLIAITLTVFITAICNLNIIANVIIVMITFALHYIIPTLPLLHLSQSHLLTSLVYCLPFPLSYRLSLPFFAVLFNSKYHGRVYGVKLGVFKPNNIEKQMLNSSY